MSSVGLSCPRRLGYRHASGDLQRNDDGVLETISATIIGNGRLDRSPCGTGVSSRMALLHKCGALATDEVIVHKSVFGTQFHGCVLEETAIGTVPAVVPQISGRAWVTDLNNVFIDPDDPLRHGHCPGDVWVSKG